jgi:hypothetical protein
MKKIIMATLFASTAFAASAVEVSAVRDYNLDANGYRVAGTVSAFNVSATRIDNEYNRFAVGKTFELTKVGKVGVSANVAGVYQDTIGGTNGYGLTAGLKATLPITKSIDVVAGVERFAGQERVKQFNGTTGTIGMNIKF